MPRCITNTGIFISKWGSFGSGDGQFNQPTTVAVDGAGNVYVTDTINYRIQVFAPAPTVASLRAKVVAFRASGNIHNDGLMQSLLAKLDAAQAALERGNINAARGQLRAFINEVSAQRGKCISVGAADQLIADANWLLASL